MRNTILITISLFFLAACERTPKIQEVKGYAQGTTYTIKFWKKNNNSKNSLDKDIDNELKRIDKLISGYRNDSYIEEFNQKKVSDTPIKLDKEIIALINKSLDVYHKSSSCFDPTIKPLFQIWGFKKDKLYIPNIEQINKIKEEVGLNKLIIGTESVTKKNANTTLDLSGIGQGYAITKLSEILESKGYKNYLVEIGGEMRVSGFKPDGKSWRIGVERPVPASQKVSEVITLTGGKPISVMTSGTYRHYFDDKGKRYSHILDPRSGKPVEHGTVATTVIINNATYADAWSTALLCLGTEEGLKAANENHIPAMFYDIDKDGKIKRTMSKYVPKQKDNWNISNNLTKNK